MGRFRTNPARIFRIIAGIVALVLFAVLCVITLGIAPMRAQNVGVSLSVFRNDDTGAYDGTEAEPLPVAIGDVLEYRITLHDTSAPPTAPAMVLSVLAPGLSIDEDSIDHGGTYDPETRALIWHLRDDTSGREVELTYRVTVTGQADDGDAVTLITGCVTVLFADNVFAQSKKTYHHLVDDKYHLAEPAEEPEDATHSAERSEASNDATPFSLSVESFDALYEVEAIADTSASVVLIDLSTLKHGATGPGWKYVDGTYPNQYTLTFDNSANAHAYTLYQSQTTVVPRKVVINADVDTSIVLSDINCVLNMNLISGAQLDLRLAGTNTMVDTVDGINSQIIVGANSSLTIDSATAPDTGSTAGTLNLSSSPNLSGAAIGGAHGADAGPIAINGGTLNIIQKATSYAAIGGSGSYTAQVTINGGKVSAAGISGAAIGGGYGLNNLKPFSATVVITGGDVNATSTGSGAAIGGGGSAHGHVTITGGTVTATNTTSSYGASIGGGVSGNGIVIISGGTITAHTLGYGAAIGSGGGTPGNNGSIPGVPTVTISGGDLNLRSKGGACIGYGGKDMNALGDNTRVGSVTITGGRVFADFEYGSVAGTGRNYSRQPLLTIDVPADIVGFGRSTSNTPGIDCGPGPSLANKNEGNAYFVNGNFVHETVSSNMMLVVYDSSNLVEPLRFVRVPFAFKEFTYTTGTTDTRTDYVYIGDPAGSGLKGVVRKSLGTLYANDPRILYAVKRPYVYYENGHGYLNYWMSLYVTWGESGFVFKYPIHEKHVDIYGEPLLPDGSESAPINDSLAMIETRKPYTGIPQDLDGYDFVGHSWQRPDASGTDFSPGVPSKSGIDAEYTVYFVYKKKPTTVDVEFTKVDALAPAKVLPSAGFKVFQLVCALSSHAHIDDLTDIVDLSAPEPCWRPLTPQGLTTDAEFTSGADGRVVLGALESGFYQIVETVAPDTYQLPVGQWLMRVDPARLDTDVDGYRLQFTAKTRSFLPPAVIRMAGESGSICYLVTNAPTLTLPLAGLSAQALAAPLGCTLIACACVLFLRRRFTIPEAGDAA